MTDIKDLLSTAIGDDEPPIGIDRDEVFRAGRQRVRRRRALAAGGVMAAVVAAVVGATVLTDFVQTPPEEVPAAEAPPAPPGPDLPLPMSTTVIAPPNSEQHVAGLTAKLYHSGLLTVDMARPWPGRSGPPGFRVENGEYRYEADITRSGRVGRLEVTVAAAPPNSAASCADLGEKYDSCTVAPGYGQPVVQATWKNAEGERRNLVVTVLPGGTKVAALVSNLSRRDADLGKPVSGGTTPLDAGELTTLVTKSGFSV
ncbi:hypothetical protein [Actinophytocola sp. KF-1]